jgi:hypothetical protein
LGPRYTEPQCNKHGCINELRPLLSNKPNQPALCLAMPAGSTYGVCFQVLTAKDPHCSATELTDRQQQWLRFGSHRCFLTAKCALACMLLVLELWQDFVVLQVVPSAGSAVMQCRRCAGWAPDTTEQITASITLSLHANTVQRRCDTAPICHDSGLLTPLVCFELLLCCQQGLSCHNQWCAP